MVTLCSSLHLFNVVAVLCANSILYEGMKGLKKNADIQTMYAPPPKKQMEAKQKGGGGWENIVVSHGNQENESQQMVDEEMRLSFCNFKSCIHANCF